MKLVLGVSGATGAAAAKILIEKSPWPVTLVASKFGKIVYQKECGEFDEIKNLAADFYEDTDLTAAISSGSVATVGMVVLPCSVNTLARIAAGITDSLITRAAHCHLKERRKLVLCVRESPWALADIQNAERVTLGGGIIMPVSPPFYMLAGQDLQTASVKTLLSAYVDRVLAVLGSSIQQDWNSVR